MLVVSWAASIILLYVLLELYIKKEKNADMGLYFG